MLLTAPDEASFTVLFALTLLLAMLTGLGPLSMDMYLASLPSIGHVLGAPPAQVQLTISFYLDRLRLRAGAATARSRTATAGGRCCS